MQFMRNNRILRVNNLKYYSSEKISEIRKQTRWFPSYTSCNCKEILFSLHPQEHQWGNKTESGNKLTVALAEGRGLDPTSRGQGECLGHVELDTVISTPLESLAEAGDLLLGYLLEARAALPLWLPFFAPLLHKAEAVSQADQYR